jgi:hypothetical protein
MAPHGDGSVTVQLMGRQVTGLGVQHAGTPEATVTVRVGQVLMYLRTAQTAERIAQIWEDAATEKLRLRQRPHPAQQQRRGRGAQDWAAPGIVVHTGGTPAGGHTLVGPPTVLAVVVGDIAFYVHDQHALADCRTVFTFAAQTAAQSLPSTHDVRLTPDAAARRGRPRERLTGAAAPGAERVLSALADVDAARRVIASQVEAMANALPDLSPALDGAAVRAARLAADAVQGRRRARPARAATPPDPSPGTAGPGIPGPRTPPTGAARGQGHPPRAPRR